MLAVAADAKPALARTAARRFGLRRGGMATAPAGSGGGAKSAGGPFWQLSHLHRLLHALPAYEYVTDSCFETSYHDGKQYRCRLVAMLTWKHLQYFFWQNDFLQKQPWRCADGLTSASADVGKILG